MTSIEDYCLEELRIAQDPSDPRHILPPALPPAARVLDVGCGAGQSLLAAYGDRTSFGVDIDMDSLQFGKTLNPRACLVNSSAEALPFNSGEFDFVFARVSLPYTNIPVSLREIRRVLKPGGRVWLTLHPFEFCWNQARRSNFKGRIFFAYILLNGLALHLFQRQFSFLGRRFESFQTGQGITKALLRSGFTDVKVERARHFVVTAQAR